MPHIVTCPNCQQNMTLPKGSFSALICPHCQAQFSMKPVLREAAAAPQQPPEAATYSPAETLLAETSPTESFSAPGPLPGELAGQVGGPLPGRPAGPRRPRGGGVLGHIIGVVGGGILGLAAGYYLLNYLGGPQFDFLGIPLPGIEHTQHQPPEPAEKTDTDLQENRRRRAASPNHRRQPADVEHSHGDPRISESDGSERVNQGETKAEPPDPKDRGYSGAELSEAIGKVRNLAEARPDNITTEIYAGFCRLSEVLTHANPNDGTVFDKRAAVRNLLAAAASSQAKLNSIGRQAARQLDDANRRENGVLLAGTMRELTTVGSYHLMRMVLFGAPREVTVVSTSRAPFQAGDKLIVAGSVVQDPSAALEEYRGPNQAVVFGGYPMRVPGR